MTTREYFFKKLMLSPEHQMNEMVPIIHLRPDYERKIWDKLKNEFPTCTHYHKEYEEYGVSMTIIDYRKSNEKNIQQLYNIINNQEGRFICFADTSEGIKFIKEHPYLNKILTILPEFIYPILEIDMYNKYKT